MPTDLDHKSVPMRSRMLGRRRRLILAYWLVQSVMVYVSWPLLACTSFSDVQYLRNDLLDFDWIATGLTIVAAVTMLQLVFVLPVRAPRRADGRRQRVPIWVKLLLASSVSTPIGVFGVMLHQAVDLLDLEDMLPVRLEPEWVFWLCWLAGLLPAIPVVSWVCRRNLPPIISAYIAGACTGLLAYAFVIAMGSLFQLSTGVEPSPATWALLGGLPMILGWVVGTPLLLAFIRKRDTETALKRLASLIFLGTAVETLAIIPIDVFVRRKSSCYCAEGSYWALVTLVPLGFLALGPMIFLVAGSKRRKRWEMGHCEICGYDMSGLPKAERCPECGAGWKAPAQAAMEESSR